LSPSAGTTAVQNVQPRSSRKASFITEEDMDVDEPVSTFTTDKPRSLSGVKNADITAFYEKLHQGTLFTQEEEHGQQIGGSSSNTPKRTGNDTPTAFNTTTTATPSLKPMFTPRASLSVKTSAESLSSDATSSSSGLYMVPTPNKRFTQSFMNEEELKARFRDHESAGSGGENVSTTSEDSGLTWVRSDENLRSNH
jgi:hypothetical protein